MLPLRSGRGDLPSKPRRQSHANIGRTGHRVSLPSRAVSLRLRSVISKASIAETTIEITSLGSSISNLLCCGEVRLDSRHSNPELTKFGTRDG
jgi:hypothetical protein